MSKEVSAEPKRRGRKPNPNKPPAAPKPPKNSTEYRTARPEISFKQVHYCDSVNPDSLRIGYIDAAKEPNDGDHLRVYPSKEVIRKGYAKCVWGKSVHEMQVIIAGENIEFLQDQINKLQTQIDAMEKHKAGWEKVIEEA